MQPQRIIVFLLALLIADTGACQSVGVVTTDQKIPIRCGANALYMLIRLNGETVELSAILDRLNSRLEGNSLLELRNAAKDLGFSTAIEKRSGSELNSAILPLIAYTKNREDAAMSDTGHFSVLLTVDANTVTYLDGTTARHERVSRKWFDKRATGHVLRLLPNAGFGRIAYASAFVVIFLSAVFLYRLLF